MVRTLRQELTGALEAAGTEDAAFDVRCMMEQVCGRDLCLITGISPEEEDRIRSMAARRMTGEPLQYILGEWEFYGLRLFVGEGVLIPRPDTETLVEAALDFCKGRESLCIADLCSGSGCIALALQELLPHAKVHAVETSDRALGYLRKNAAYHGDRIAVHRADVLDARTAEGFSGVDVIVSNPPYLTAEDMQHLQREVQHEPEMALYGASADGLHFYREITRLWKGTLREGGLLAFEVGIGQAEAVRQILEAQGFGSIRILPDLAGVERVVAGICPTP